MIPNAGLDNIATYNAWRYLTGSSNPTSGNDWLGYAAISEDSTAPLATDTNIGTERARTNSTGGFDRIATAIRDPNTDRLGLSIERAYVFSISGNWNITKYGYVPLSSGGNFSWIDLVRSDPNDPQSSPITLTLEDGDQLQLWCTFTVTVPWSVDLESFVITGSAGNDSAGTHDAYCGFYAENDTLDGSPTGIADLIGNLFWPGSPAGQYPAVATTQTPNIPRDERMAPSATPSVASADRVRETYVSGTYYRDATFKWGTSDANQATTAIMLTAGTGLYAARVNNPHGFKIVFDDPSTFVKENTHELTLTFRASWQEG